MKKLLFAHPWFAAYNNDPPPPPPANDPPPPPPPPPKTFTQEQLNKILAEDKRKHQEQVKATVEQLEEMKKTVQLTEEQRVALEGRIETLSNSLLTKEEQAKQELAKKDKELKSAVDGLSKERDQWKNNYSSEVITNQILRASSVHKVVSSDQMLDLLMPKTRLVEVLGSDGKTVVGHAPKVKFRAPNEKGEDVELDLTIEETIKRMKDLPERFGNLFESGVTGGLGGKGSSGGGSGGSNITDLAKQSPEAYRANRQRFGLGRKK